MSDLSRQASQFLLFRSESGEVKLEVLVRDDTVWLTQSALAELFGVQRPAITKHLRNIFVSGELVEKSVRSILEHTADDGKNYKTSFYNLDAIISVGYRINSLRATQFRIWATKVLRDYIVKGFVLDDDRLRQGTRVFGNDYFRELLERVRSIRASERRVYQQITDIFQECSIDYDANSTTTRTFSAMVQKKFHFAITGKTAAEIIFEKADSRKENMGLTTWRNSPSGRILRTDAKIAKNYLSETDIKKLERTVTSYFDYIENQIELRRAFTMAELADSVDRFLSFNDFRVLSDQGRVSREQADEKADVEYSKFNRTQRIESDFDKVIRHLKSGDLPKSENP